MLVALTGPAGCGKSTIAEALEEQHGFARLRFAGPIKDMLLALGLTAEQVDGALKEKPSTLLGGKTPRDAMRDLGTRWGREFDPTIWTRATMHRVDGLLLAHRDVVIDDCRFANEARAVMQAGGVIAEVVRPGVLYSREHVSEEPLPGELVDYRITNSQTPGHAAAELLAKLGITAAKCQACAGDGYRTYGNRGEETEDCKKCRGRGTVLAQGITWNAN